MQLNHNQKIPAEQGRQLTFVSLMAANFTAACRKLAHHFEFSFLEEADWTEHRQALADGRAGLAALCGLVYIDWPQTLQLLAAPVPKGDKYNRKPIYYSEVVVAAEAPFTAFEELAGRSLAINEPRSHSGCAIIGYELARRGLTTDFLGPVRQSGGHRASLGLVAEGVVDWAAIDSTVFDYWAEREPALFDTLRSLGRLGPSPHPPLVAQGLPADAVAELRQRMLNLPTDFLSEFGYQGLAEVTDADYDRLREMSQMAATCWPVRG
ncbi:MAG: PhnD/SsuA/transferrin family substrate-binding protein [Candidatus Eremiobacteraeota bacterium]|nr:PhnD/SsuA/transferrin family substrate-binding protein [Candidatus Eremiobacteraeota bacterium]